MTFANTLLTLFILLSLLHSIKPDNYIPFDCPTDGPELFASIYKPFSEERYSRLPQIVGYKEIVEDMHGLILNPIKYPEEYRGLLQVNRGAMLYGPPGVGKTLLVRHLEKELHELGWQVWYIKTSDVMKTAFINDSEQRLQCIFSMVNNRNLTRKDPAVAKKDAWLESILGADANSLKNLGFSIKTVTVDPKGGMKEVNDWSDLNTEFSFSTDDYEKKLQEFLSKDDAVVENEEAAVHGGLREDGTATVSSTTPGDSTTEQSSSSGEGATTSEKTENAHPTSTTEPPPPKVLLVFDEGEAIFTREKKHNGGVVAELLQQLNDIGNANFSIVVMTNRPALIDSALRRRLGNQYCIRFPTQKERRELFRTSLLRDGWKLSRNIDYENFDDKTALFASDDILRLVQWMVRAKVRGVTPPFRKNAPPFTDQDLKDALEHVKATSTREELVEYASYSKLHSKSCFQEFIPDPVVQHVNASAVPEEEPRVW